MVFLRNLPRQDSSGARARAAARCEQRDPTLRSMVSLRNLLYFATGSELRFVEREHAGRAVQHRVGVGPRLRQDMLAEEPRRYDLGGKEIAVAFRNSEASLRDDTRRAP